jgi:hypothetical protein
VILLVTIPPVFDEREIRIRLGGCGCHVVIIPALSSQDILIKVRHFTVSDKLVLGQKYQIVFFPLVSGRG